MGSIVEPAGADVAGLAAAPHGTSTAPPAASTSGGWAGVPENTLRYKADLCANCGVCLDVCPHAVFEPGDRAVRLVRPEACMECGACQRNCVAGAIVVDSGVGCAAAYIYAALTGREPNCGGPPGPSCCGGEPGR